MTEAEQAAILKILDAVNSSNAAVAGLLVRIETMERAIQSLHYRLQLQECGTALYEISNGIPMEAH